MSGKFLDMLDFHLEGPTSELVILNTDLRYKASDGTLFTVPAGFRNDLASVPGWLRSIAPPWQQSARAGVLHDCGYRWFEVWGIERVGIDRLFGEALRADQTGVLRTQTMVTAVRLFGQTPWSHWRNLAEAAKGVKPSVPAR